MELYQCSLTQTGALKPSALILTRKFNTSFIPHTLLFHL